jgi:hypothetical protein
LLVVPFVVLAAVAVAGCSAGGAAAGAPMDAGTSQFVPTIADGAAADAVDQAPGRYLTDATVTGAGACAGVPLSAVLAAIRAANPDLAAVTTLFDPAQQGSGDGSFIYAYLRADGGFAVVFKLGLGDCPAGCTENDYRYFRTDAACAPVQVGHYHTSWGTGSCLDVDGAPMWGHPPPPDPLIVCGADNAPADLGGSYQLGAAGQRQACVATASSAAVIAVSATVTMTIAQDPGALGTGTVTFQGTGHPLVDGIPLPAQFQRRRFDAALQSGNLPNACPRTQSVTAQYDFEGYQPGGIDVVESGSTAGCTACKGYMRLTLSSP